MQGVIKSYDPRTGAGVLVDDRDRARIGAAVRVQPGYRSCAIDADIDAEAGPVVEGPVALHRGK